MAFGSVKQSVLVKALDYCKLNLVWPPSIAEFLDICERMDGMPTFEEAFKLLVRREWSHPIIEQMYALIGDWELRMGAEMDLRKRVATVYKDLRERMRVK